MRGLNPSNRPGALNRHLNSLFDFLDYFCYNKFIKRKAGIKKMMFAFLLVGLIGYLYYKTFQDLSNRKDR